ncbi:MAG: hypothetical protein ABIH23_21585 [bacterium]
MSRQSLRRLWIHPALDQPRDECVTQCVKVRKTPFGFVFDFRISKIDPESLYRSLRHTKGQLLIVLRREVFPQARHELMRKRLYVLTPVLGESCSHRHHGRVAIQVEGRFPKCPNFICPQARQYRKTIDQRSLRPRAVLKDTPRFSGSEKAVEFIVRQRPAIMPPIYSGVESPQMLERIARETPIPIRPTAELFRARKRIIQRLGRFAFVSQFTDGILNP